jgi:hypothetical protein
MDISRMSESHVATATAGQDDPIRNLNVVDI